MTSRRQFLGVSAAAAIASVGTQAIHAQPPSQPATKPIVVSTWQHGLNANAAAWKVLNSGGTALDAVESGVRDSEADPKVDSVGLGGLPDRDGNVTLDACIMDERGRCGSVAFLTEIKHPISVARRVMEKTPHVMLVGEGAKQFALAEGFAKENLLTESSRQAWEKWKQSKPKATEKRGNAKDHDTIGMVALDSKGNLSGACTTSGLAWKMHGRVGDSPIIGAGLYVDNEVGAASATGVGEAVIRAVGSFLVVEFMRQGKSPEEACRLAVERVTQKTPGWREIQVGFIALDKQGRVGGYSIQPEFQYAVYDSTGGNRLISAASRIAK
jgi:N4-(beta-N-acetylglucosaminyl)-L-asparaginase